MINVLNHPFFRHSNGHSSKIIEFFGIDNVLLSDAVSINRRMSPVFLCFTNRCGSNALAEDIGFLDGCGFFGEMLNFDVVINHSQKKKLDHFHHYLDHIFSDANLRIPVIKASFEQLVFLYESGYLKNYFLAPKFILLERRDLLEQAISLFIADTTKQWASFQNSSAPPPELDSDAILTIMNSISSENSKFKTFFSLMGQSYLHLIYERYCRDRMGVIGQVAGLLEIDFLPEPFPAKRLEKQSMTEKDLYKRKVIKKYKI